MPIDFRADKNANIRNGDAVVATGGDNTHQTLSRPEIQSLPSGAYLAWALNADNRFRLDPSGWSA